MTEFGRLVLLIGDYHTPQRQIGMVLCTGNVGSQSVAEHLRTIAGEDLFIISLAGTPSNSVCYLLPVGIDQCLASCLTVFFRTVQVFSRTLCIRKDCHIVCGDADHDFNFPETCVTNVGDFKVGVVHGHQLVPWGDDNSLVKFAGRLGVDILVSGHTHRNSIVELGGKFLINPGSVTGACNAVGEFDITPSFMLMAVQEKSETRLQFSGKTSELQTAYLWDWAISGLLDWNCFILFMPSLKSDSARHDLCHHSMVAPLSTYERRQVVPVQQACHASKTMKVKNFNNFSLEDGINGGDDVKAVRLLFFKTETGPQRGALDISMLFIRNTWYSDT
eukprot:g9473.t1